MHLFPRQKKKGQVDAELLLKVRKELEKMYSRPTAGKEFISRPTALGVLTRDRVGDLFRKLSWYKEDERDELWPQMGSIICILITINFVNWEDFKAIFFAGNPGQAKPRFTDKSLPIEDLAYLPSYLQEDFYRQQYTFLPIVIEKDTHRRYDENYRLPILRTESLPNIGSQGDVDKVYIESGYLQFSRTTHNSTVQVMARKRITRETRRGRQSFVTEQTNLNQFKRSLINHTHIMQSFASFEHGSDFVILSEWAQGRDLNQFLYRPDLALDDYPSRSLRFSPYNLLTEMYALAEALDFLHHHMVNSRGAKYKCAHLDLKPENILVCIPDYGNPADTPVGRWKITDFGLSNVEVSVARGDLVPTPPAAENLGGLAPGTLLGELSLRRPLRRGPGPFQPPEVRDADTAKVSTRRDVWSFGCILAMVLAFALGGPEEVTYQQQCRSKGADDYFYLRHNRHMASGASVRSSGHGLADAEVKPDIRNWLNERAPRIAAQHSPWVQHCSNLVLRLLEVDVVRRPEMNQAVADLQALLEHTEHQAQDRVWNFDASTLLPEPVPVVPVVPEMQLQRDTSSTGSAGPLVGVRDRTNSSPSLTPTLPSNSGKHALSVITAGYKLDPSFRYIRFQTLQKCRFAGICPRGLSTVFWSDAGLLVYDVSAIHDEHEFWLESPSHAANISENQMPLSICRILASESYKCQKVALNGPYLAILEVAQRSTYAIRMYSRVPTVDGKPLAFTKRVTRILDAIPDDMKLSSKGFCLLRFSNKLQLITFEGLANIPIGNGDVMGFDFTGDGRAFCLWTKENNQHCWSIWDHNLKQLGTTITYQIKTHGLPPAREAFLFAFHGYPRFIACDKYGYIFLVCADSTGDRVQRLGHTENVFAGLMLPQDDAFLLVRASEHSRQKIQRINLSSMGNRASFRPYDCGVLSQNIEKARSGICVRPYTGSEAGQCVLTLSPSGELIRKTFRD